MPNPSKCVPPNRYFKPIRISAYRRIVYQSYSTQNKSACQLEKNPPEGIFVDFYKNHPGGFVTYF